MKTQDISCFGDSTGTITVTASNGNAPYTYAINGSSPQNPGQFGSLSAGAYQIIVTDSNGCSLIIDTTLSEPPALIGTISLDQDLCEGESAEISSSASGGIPPYSFLWNNNATNQSINVSPSSTSIFSVIISDSNGCPYLDSCTINVTPLPVIDVIANPISGNSPLTVIFNNNTLNANSYLWDFGNGQTLSTSNASQESSVYLQVGIFNVELTASNGPCESKRYQDIEVIPYEELEIEVPNFFSPDNDGSNDVYLLNLKNAVSINAIIVNRWGNKMAELTNLTDVWDGKINGAPAEEGVYFISYTVEGLNGEKISGHTFFHLIR